MIRFIRKHPYRVTWIVLGIYVLLAIVYANGVGDCWSWAC